VLPLAEVRAQMQAGLVEPFRHIGLFLRSSGIGTFVGAIPGVGGSVAQFMSYNVALASAKEPEKFGRGSVEGLVATEAAINSKEGGSLFPTLLFGIPGTAEMALVLAAWQLHGLDPGPLFMSKHADLAWALIFGLLVSNLINSALTIVGSPLLSRIPNMDVRLVSPAVLVASALAVYSIRQNFWDVVVVMLIGLLGYFQKAYGYPVIGTVIGFVLGSVIETNFHFALQSSLGSYWIFIGSTISVVLVALCLLAAAWAVRQVLRDRRLARGT
jgi:putative tricarboxylic transport membrane protein